MKLRETRTETNYKTDKQINARIKIAKVLKDDNKYH